MSDNSNSNNNNNNMLQMPTENKKVRLRVIRGTNLVASASNGWSNPFCKISDLQNKGRNALRTRTLNRTLYPIWNETFDIELDESNKFEIAIYSYNKWFLNDFLGSKKVRLPRAITELGGTLVKGQEKIVTFILDKTVQGFVELGITALNFEMESHPDPPLSHVKKVWDLYIGCENNKQGMSRLEREQDEEDEDEDEEDDKETGEIDVEGKRKGEETADLIKPKEEEWRWMIEDEEEEEEAEAEVGAETGECGSEGADVKGGEERSRESEECGESRSECTGDETAGNVPTAGTPITVSASSYLQLLPPELIEHICHYVAFNTPFDPFDYWTPEEKQLFEHLRKKRKWKELKINTMYIEAHLANRKRRGENEMKNNNQRVKHRAITFHAPDSMKRFTFKSMQKGRLTVRQYMINLHDVPLENELLRSNKYTLCNLYSINPREKFKDWEFFLIRRYRKTHSYGFVQNKEDLLNFIAQIIGRHHLATVIEGDREMTIGGKRAIGCTFLMYVSVPPHLTGSSHRTYNCVTNFFIIVDDLYCYQFQYLTYWTKGNAAKALANHRKKEQRTFFWMLKSVAFKGNQLQAT